MLAGTPTTERLGAVRRLVRRGAITSALEALDGAPPASGVVADVLRVDCRLARGQLAEATDACARLEAAVDGPESALARWSLGELATTHGHDEIALEHYLAAADDRVPWRSGAALALMRLSRQREAEALAREHLALAREHGSPYEVVVALRTLAAVQTDAARLDHLTEARRLAHEEGAQRLAAQVDADRAGLLALVPDPAARAEAVAMLGPALAYADREDLWPLHQRIRKLLLVLGQPAPEITSEALARLSPAELRAARLAASGLTNKAIAQVIGVTDRSVEWHLSHVYRKLGVARRAELTTRLPG